jgi:PAS domain S-box-containing protein
MRKENGRNGSPSRRTGRAVRPSRERTNGHKKGPPVGKDGGNRPDAIPEMFGELVDAAPLLVWMADAEGRMTYVNAQWHAFTGRRKDQDLGTGWLENIHPDDAPTVLETYRSAIRAHQPFKMEFRLRHAGGDFRTVLVSGTPRLRGRKLSGYMGTAIDISARKRSQEALRDSVSRYRELADSIGDVFCALDRGFRFTYWNKACEQITGKAATEVIGQTLRDLFPETAGGDLEELITRVESTGKPGTTEIDVPGNGQPTCLEVLVYPSRSGASIIAKDITPRLAAERALQASEAKYRNIFEHANDAIVVFEPRTERILEANVRALELYGFSREEFIGMSLKRLTMDVARGEMQITETLQSGAYNDFETVHFRKDGTPVSLSVNASVIDFRGQPAILSVNRDISRFHSSDDILKSQQNILQHLLANTDDIVFMQDREGRYLFYNGSPKYGLGMDDVRGKTPYDFHAPSTARKMMERLYQVISSGRSVSAETKVDWGGETIWFLDQHSPVRNAEGEVISVVTISRNITERKRAEERLRRSEERYRAFIEQSSDGIWRFETVRPIATSLPVDEQIDQIFEYCYLGECNDAMLSMLGEPSAEAIIGTPAGSLMSKSGRQNIDGMRTFITSSYRLTDAESREVSPDGEVRYFLNTLLGMVEDGHLVRIWGSRRDITARKQVEREIRLLAQTITSTKDCVSITDLDHRILFVNDAFLATYGFTEEDLIGGPMSRLNAPSMSGEVADQILSATLQGGWYGEVVHRRKDGTEFPLEVWTSVVRNDEGDPVATVGVARDITERKRMEQALRQSEARLRRITDAMRDVVTQTDLEGNVQYVSPSIAQVLGYRPEDVLGQPVFGRVHPDDRDRVRATLGAAVYNRTGGRLEFRYLHADGRVLWLEAVGSLLIDSGGKVTGAVIGTRDITERKRVEEQITTSLREKEVLLKEIHHRVKNNLQVISSLLSLQSEHINDEEIRRALKESQNRVRSMAIIHQRLYQSGNLAEINFGGYIKELCSQLFRSYGASSRQINLSTTADEVALGVDKAIPCGIILNELVSNSLKYAFPNDQGGTISVELRMREAAIELLVSDDGVGLPAGFDYRTAESLGLKLVHMLVEQIMGTLTQNAEHPAGMDRPGIRWTVTFSK